MLIKMHKPRHEEHLSQPLQTHNKHFELAVTFSIAYNGIFNVTTKTFKLNFAKSSTDEDGFIQITNPPRAHGLESLNDEIKKIFVPEEYFTEADHPFNIKPNFSKPKTYQRVFQTRTIYLFYS